MTPYLSRITLIYMKSIEMVRLWSSMCINNSFDLLNKIMSFAGGPTSLLFVSIRAKLTQCNEEKNQINIYIFQRERSDQRTSEQGSKDPLGPNDSKPSIGNSRRSIQGPQLLIDISYKNSILNLLTFSKTLHTSGHCFLNNIANLMSFIPKDDKMNYLYYYINQISLI